MQYRACNILAAILLLVSAPARADTAFKGIYDLDMGGMRFGKVGVELTENPSHYAMAADVTFTGLVKLFASHSSHTTVVGDGAAYDYPTRNYETHYRTKKKRKSVKMVMKAGKIVEEAVVPPDNRATRPAVPAADKNAAFDPLSLIVKMRREIAANKNTFSINAYDGRRLTEVDFTMLGKRTLQSSDKKTPVIAVNVRRKLLAGFTASEIDDWNSKEPALTIYLSDDARLIPLKFEVPMWFGMVSATLVKECAASESCLLGISE
jgi:hypothetical protein